MTGFLKPFADHLYHFAPIPLYKRVLAPDDRDAFHASLVEVARGRFPEERLEVPDERHAATLGHVPTFDEREWVEEIPPAIGIWHKVPTNDFLDLDTEPTRRLRREIESAYLHALRALGQDDGRPPVMTESWIQLYKNGDRKVLHNHERYGPPRYDRMWAGAYYVSTGHPDPAMKYAGVLSFEVRGTHYCVRPEPGLLLLWPADVLHEVHPFYGATERIVINFNLGLELPGETTAVGNFLRRVRRRLS